MKKITTTYFVAALLLVGFLGKAQSVRRSVIASIGHSGEASGIRLSCTVAQPPNAGTIGNNGVRLRQGFQQPVNDSSVDPACIGSPRAIFDFQNAQNACGERFNFLYADVPEAATVFSWNFGQDALPPTSTEQNPQGVAYATIGNKIVSLEVTTGNCSFSINSTVDVTTPSFSAYSQGTSVDCFDDADGSVTLTPVNGTLPYEFVWENGATTALLSGLSPGDYAFTVSDAIGCSFSSKGTVTGPDSIAVSAAVTVETCNDSNDGAVNLNVSGGVAPYIYKWSNSAATEDLTNLSGEIFAVTVTDATGCHKSKDEIIVLTVCEGFDFTNLITPNGDGSNETWAVAGIDNFPGNEFEVFTRWGHPVFYQKDYDNTWQGTNDAGDPLSIGAYFYILKLNDAANTVYSGSISILR